MRTQLWRAIDAGEALALRPRAGLGVWVLRWLLLVVVAPILALHLGAGLGYEVRQVLAPEQIKPLDPGSPGLGFVVSLPGSAGDQRGEPYSRLRLFEDGVELGPGHQNLAGHVDERGQGRYLHWGEELRFSSSEGSDPRSSGRTYEVRYPSVALPAWLCLALVAAAFLLWAEPLRRALLRLERTDPRWILLGLCALTLALRALWGWDTGIVNDNRIQTLPYSDAKGWFDMSADFARGVRSSAAWPSWDARRPLTYVINGSWQALWGVSPLSLAILNSIFAALSAALIFDALRRFLPLPIALACSLLQVFSLMDAAFGTTALSEPSGFFLSNVALWLLVRAFVGERRGEAPRALYVAAAALLVLSNLARPLTLLSLAGFPLVAFLVLAKRRLSKPALLLGTARVGLCLALGAGACLGPWVVRQKLTYDLWTLSDNTAEMLFAASDPRYPEWTPEASAEASAAGHHSFSARSRYFNARFKDNLRHHASYYAGVVVSRAGDSLVNQLSMPRWWVVGLLLLALWSSGARRQRGEFLVYSGAALAVALAAALGLPTPHVWPLVFVASLAALWQRDLALLLVASLGLTLVSIGAVAAPFPRFTYSLHWLALALELWAIWQLARWARLGSPPPDMESLQAARQQPELPGELAAARALKRALLALLMILGLGLAIALVRTQAPALPAPSSRVPDAEAWRSRVLAGPEARDYDALRSSLVLRRLNLQTTCLASFAAGESYEHESGLFVRRPYAHSHAYTSPPLAPPPERGLRFEHALLPRRLSDQGALEITALGAWVAYGSPTWGAQPVVFEVVAFTRSADLSGADWIWASEEERRAQAKVLGAKEQAGEVFSPERRD